MFGFDREIKKRQVERPMKIPLLYKALSSKFFMICIIVHYLFGIYP